MNKILDPKEAALLHLSIAVQNFKKHFNTKKYKEFDLFVSSWNKILSESDSTKRKLVEKITPLFVKIEEFEFPISFYPEEYDFIISWDINYAVECLLKNRKQIESLNPSDIFIDDKSINKKTGYQKIENPIIVISPSVITSVGHLVINGNHRIFEAKKQENKILSGYIVDDHEHLQWMTTDLMRNFYLMIQDLKTIALYLSKPTWKWNKINLKSLNIWQLSNNTK
jgi:hypothetical protein